MKPSLSAAADALHTAEQAWAAGKPQRARPQLEQALDLLTRLRPSQDRDALLARTHLGLHQLSEQAGQQGRSERHLRWGVSYARTAGDGAVRTYAQEMWNRWQSHSRQ
ncbi:hypothetical protein [Deinococcus radiophilus]|uniref:Tetratricopeptide repeat protein n=1 Tax=Deinococcus radiophilus TaxID=32062 RepID=A0A3S0K8R9_9DEIO|nr:hypothetical protein [Deinococcus radiophilus]RTR25227.1 hypothetical protein EJ104_11820 [Deinococcus radiophilus]UFA50245.1 hypothetical protein LMT64_10285 [Deinococcus radiophilus]